jgi:hypothetical protein
LAGGVVAVVVGRGDGGCDEDALFFGHDGDEPVDDGFQLVVRSSFRGG